MRKFFIILAAVLLTASVFMPQQTSAQAPEKMSYQAIIRNSSSQLVKSQAVGMQISILQGTVNGTVVYVETQTATTNANGLISIEIGTGNTTDDFSTIDWANGPYFIKIETDPNGGTEYTIVGTSQLVSVPYALYAKTSGSSTPGPQGPAGIDGEDGEDGVQGVPGVDGPQGATGADGAQGVQGETGIAGAKGDKGDVGEAGAKGDKGDTGVQGIQGIQGATGADGLTTSVNGVTQVSGTITITKSDIALGNVDNISDANKPVSIATQKTLDLKVDKDGSKVLSTNDYTTAEQTKLATITGTNTGDQDGSETKLTAGTNVTVTGTGTTASPYVVNATSGSSGHYVGEFYGGGIVFWIDETGEHGLVCAKSDQGSTIRWHAGTAGVTRATGDGPFSGELNTSIIISSQVSIGDDGNDYAAQICNELQITEGGKTYGDWYLPAKQELNLMYLNKTAINTTAIVNGGVAFFDLYYCCSTEHNDTHAWIQLFNSYGHQTTNGKQHSVNLRAVRAF